MDIDTMDAPALREAYRQLWENYEHLSQAQAALTQELKYLSEPPRHGDGVQGAGGATREGPARRKGEIVGSNLAPVETVVEDLYRSVMVHSNSAIWHERIREALQARETTPHAYRERNALVAFLSRCYPSHLATHPAEDTSWHPAWRTIVCIHAEKAPGGSMRRLERWTLCWYIHNDEVPLFSHLEMQENDWDGSSTEATYERLRRLP